MPVLFTARRNAKPLSIIRLSYAPLSSVFASLSTGRGLTLWICRKEHRATVNGEKQEIKY